MFFWQLFNIELQHIRQLLSNNGYPISMIDKVANETISAFVHRQSKQDSNKDPVCFTHQDYPPLVLQKPNVSSLQR